MTDLTEYVRPLEWEKHPVGIIASTGQGTSYIVDDRNFRPAFIKWPSGNFAPDVGSLVEAKAAAQADYARRILSTIDLDALIAAGVKAGLEMAAEQADTCCTRAYRTQGEVIAAIEQRKSVSDTIRATSPDAIASAVARVKGEAG